MFYVCDGQGKKSEMFNTKEEAVEHLRNLETLANALRCDWEYSTEDNLIVSDDNHVLNTFSIYKKANYTDTA